MIQAELAAILRDHEVPRETAITLIAIATAESGLNPAAEGDSIDNYTGYWRQLYTPYAAHNFLAFGLFQVFTYWHHESLIFKTKSYDPEDWARWLKDPENNVTIALEIHAKQGFEAWSVYKAGSHAQYLTAARIAWDSLPPFTPDPPQALDEGEASTIIRTLEHITDRLRIYFELPRTP